MFGWFFEFLIKYLPILLPKSMRPGYLRVGILGIDRTLTLAFVKPVNKAFIIGKKRYEVTTDLINYLGRMRTPISFYIENKAQAIDLRTRTPQEALNADENYERMESHIARDTLSAFDDKGWAGQTPIIIVLVAIVLVGIGLFYQMNVSFGELETLLRGGENLAQNRP